MSKHQETFLHYLLKLANETSQSRASIYADFTAAISGAIADAASSGTQYQESLLELRQKYSEAQFDCFQQMMSCVSESYQENYKQDFLGEIIMGENLIENIDEENFIPYNVAEIFAAITSHDYKTETAFGGHLSIIDPYCASGATVIAALNNIKAQGLDYSKCAMCTCQATNITAAQTCYIQLAVLGCAASVRVRPNSSPPIMVQELFVTEETLCTPAFYDMIWHARRLAMINQFPIE